MPVRKRLFAVGPERTMANVGATGACPHRTVELSASRRTLVPSDTCR
jgi:hypothetical protein